MNRILDHTSFNTLNQIAFIPTLALRNGSDYNSSLISLYQVACVLRFLLYIWGNYNARQHERPLPPSAVQVARKPFLSRICGNCQRFFLEPREPSKVSEWPKFNLHSQTVSILRQNAELGCPFCAMVNRTLDSSVPVDESIGFSIIQQDDYRGWTLSVLYGSRRTAHPVDLALMPCDDNMRSLISTDSGDGAIEESNESANSRQLVRHWHSYCKINHRRCQQDSTKERKWRPNRLLAFMSLHEKGKNKVRLVDGASLPPRTEYTALSHCWGKVHVMKLLASTEAELRSGIPITRLPKTFQHAITDSADDWQSEAQMMKHVYSNGAITIVATHARDSTEGLFVKRQPISIVPPIIPCVWNPALANQNYCVVDKRLTMGDIDFSNLATRAWTVQERALSPRLLTFTRSQMFYECLETHLCESWPRSRAPLQADTFMELLKSNTSPERIWSTIASAYSYSSLTREEDKIIALAGISEAMQARLNDEYVVGLWKWRLPIGLLWCVPNARKPRPNPCIDPTWSWLSTSNNVAVEEAARPAGLRTVLLTIINISVDLVDPTYPTGDVRPGALLQIRGRLKPARWNLLPQYSFSDFRKYQITFDGLPGPSKKLDLDFFTHVDTRPGLWLTFLKIFILPVAIFVEGGGGNNRIGGLILTPKDAEAEIYERVGHLDFRCNTDHSYSSYLFLERLLHHSRDKSPVEPVLDQGGLVEGFPFDGGAEWTRIKEKDIVIM
ncbi:hypothetical protein K456DRAFT_32223 [Colletotrichum gloeosporioides 23]|nr:hypothetical protein K456DRAFT_32223 [Colletotrichum gloeosporioides 23]